MNASTAPAAPIEVVPSGAPLGQEIRGVDLSRPVGDEVFARILEAFGAGGVIVFRDQKLTPEQQIAFSRRFGELAQYIVNDFSLPGHSEIFVVSNVVENGRPIGLEDAGRLWHSDMCFTEHPPQGSLLYALEVPVKDGEPLGDTYFASTAAAYDALPEQTRKKIEHLKVVNSYAHYAQLKSAARAAAGAAPSAVKIEPAPDVIHPIVRVHPRTGRKCIYVSDGISVRVPGLSDEEGRALIAELIAHVTRPEFVYRHRWRVGDLVVWDNCSAVHRATGGYAPLRRRMHRTTIAAAAAPSAA